MPLLDAAINHFETVQRALRLSPPLRRAGGVAFLLLVGCFQYLALPQLAKSPFYLLALIPIAFLEPLPIATAFSVLAAAISFGAEVLADPGCAALVFPYWSALARLIGFGLVTTAISMAVGEHGRLRLSERALQEKVRELEDDEPRPRGEHAGTPQAARDARGEGAAGRRCRSGPGGDVRNRAAPDVHVGVQRRVAAIGRAEREHSPSRREDLGASRGYGADPERRARGAEGR